MRRGLLAESSGFPVFELTSERCGTSAVHFLSMTGSLAGSLSRRVTMLRPWLFAQNRRCRSKSEIDSLAWNRHN